jgi:hypothetical protein
MYSEWLIVPVGRGYIRAVINAPHILLAARIRAVHHRCRYVFRMVNCSRRARIHPRRYQCSAYPFGGTHVCVFMLRISFWRHACMRVYAPHILLAARMYACPTAVKNSTVCLCNTHTAFALLRFRRGDRF